jgi:hypothetical protein
VDREHDKHAVMGREGQRRRLDAGEQLLVQDILCDAVGGEQGPGTVKNNGDLQRASPSDKLYVVRYSLNL